MWSTNLPRRSSHGTDTGLCLQLVTATRSAKCCSFFTHVLDTGGQPIGACSYTPVQHGRAAYLPRCSPHGTDMIPASLHARYGHKVLLNAAGPLPTQVVNPASMMSFPCRECPSHETDTCPCQLARYGHKQILTTWFVGMLPYTRPLPQQRRSADLMTSFSCSEAALECSSSQQPTSPPLPTYLHTTLPTYVYSFVHAQLIV